MSNFVGWALLSWAITGVFLLLERTFLRQRWGEWRGYPGDALAGATLFAGVVAFNLAITFAIGETLLALAGCLWTALLLAPMLARIPRGRGLKRPAWD